MNLLISDFYRIVKDKVLYVMLGALAVLSLLMCVVLNLLYGDNTPIVTEVMMRCLGVDTMGVIIGIAVALFTGKDYEHNTIRNKICCGEGRYKIYLTKLIESIVIASLFFGFTMLCCTLFGAFFGFEFKVADEFWEKVTCEWLIVLGFTAIVNCICVTTKSSKITIIFTVVQFVVFNALGRMLPTISDGTLVKVICRALYFTVSNMLLDSTNGLYTANIFSDGQRITVEYGSMFLNAILASLIYIALAISISIFVVRKQEYK